MSPLSPTAPRPHMEVIVLVNAIKARVKDRADIFRARYGAFVPFPALVERAAVSSSAASETRRLLTVLSGVDRIQEVLRKPFFVATTGAEDSFMAFSRECVRTMRTDLLSKGYEESTGDVTSDFATRWTESSEEARTATIFRDVLARALTQVHGLYYDSKKPPHLTKSLARTIHYRRHGWPMIPHANLSITSEVNLNEPQDLGLLLRVTKTQTGLWRVLQNLVVVATVLSVESGYDDPRPTTGSAAQRNLREDWTSFAYACCISPLGLLAPFTMHSDLTSEVPVHQVCDKTVLFSVHPSCLDQ